MDRPNHESTVSTGRQIQAEGAWWGHLLWVLAGAVLGFVIASVFAGLLRLSRPLYLIPYVVLVVPLLYGYIRWSKLSLRRCMLHHWGWGVVGGVLVGIFAVQSVVRQPSSSMPQGIQLLIDLLWLGVVYGTVDGLLLSVLPVFAVWNALAREGWTAHWPGRIGTGLLALLVSMGVIAVYHLGYPEFRGHQVMFPVFGVAMMSLAYIITGNPISALISHIAMHIAAVLYGLQTAMQLPPHY